MGEKLKSIISPIPWFSLLKPLAAAAAWLWLPWWGFLVVILYCYLLPWFRPASLAAPFLVLLFLAFVITPTPLAATSRLRGPLVAPSIDMRLVTEMGEPTG